MKTRSSWLVGLLAAGLCAAGLASLGREPAGPSIRDAMRFKLHYAQGILEGITMENYPLIVTNTLKLAALAKSTEWKVRTTPDYQRLSEDFLRQTEALRRAAEKKNVDAATVAYFQMTVSCVNCHRHLRGVEAAQLKPPTGPTAVAFVRP
jgi:hypothetical protein